MALHGQGWPMERTARTLGVNRKTVRGWVNFSCRLTPTVTAFSAS
ncbi:helix-turn-helix domain-containing protein [Azospirillum brasilense]